MTSGLPGERVAYLNEMARQIRVLIAEMSYNVGPERRAHPGPALSIADILSVLYFEVMRIDPENPRWEDRDRFILSKGHSCPVLYAALALRGFFPLEELATLRHVNSILQGHPDMTKTPGVDMTTGSLGHGLSAAIGMALAAKFIDKKDYRIYVMLGCGEMQEGLVWEGAMYAGFHGLDNITVFVDYNRFQSGSNTCELLNIEPLRQKWEAFGWNVLECNGHDVSQIFEAIETARNTKTVPTVIIAHTVKGKGISFMENENSWHQKELSEDEYKQALAELEAGR